jgi:hypothetical protein
VTPCRSAPGAGPEAEIRNEGAPFRLPRPAYPSEVRRKRRHVSARILQQHSTGCGSEQHSQTLQAGLTELAEPSYYSNGSRGASTTCAIFVRNCLCRRRCDCMPVDNHVVQEDGGVATLRLLFVCSKRGLTPTPNSFSPLRGCWSLLESSQALSRGCWQGLSRVSFSGAEVTPI